LIETRADWAPGGPPHGRGDDNGKGNKTERETVPAVRKL
jgi:hypothetical protein